MEYSSGKVLVVIVIFFMAIMVTQTNGDCAYDAIFVFGDSNSDTGGFYAAFPPQSGPYGMTYFNKPSGRSTDGRVFVDFLAQGLGLPHTTPYLQSMASDFRHGANYATAASTVAQPSTSVFVTGVSPFYLAIQINQMKNFKAKVDELQSQGQSNLPKPDIFGKALYVIYIGQNDFTGLAGSAGPGGVKDIFPQLLWGTTSAIRELYRLGGRTIMALNMGPVGCYPAFLVQFPHSPSDLDSAGCITSYNNAVNDYNDQLRNTLHQLRGELKDANIIYVDTNSVLKELYHNPTAHGFEHGTTACCGYGGGSYNYDPRVFCGSTKDIDGTTVTASACGDPEKYVSWDGVHVTEAANRHMAYNILASRIFEPAFDMSKYCDIHPIG